MADLLNHLFKICFLCLVIGPTQLGAERKYEKANVKKKPLDRKVAM